MVNFTKWHLGIPLGQFLAILLAISGSCTASLRPANLPLFQLALLNILICTVYTPLLAFKQKKLNVKIYHYAGISFLDIFASYLTMTSLKYTDVTSWSLLLCSNIIAVVPLTACLLKARYKIGHYFGMAFSLIGTILLIIGDSQDNESFSINKKAILGDIMLILGSFIYCLNNIYIEYIVKKYKYNFNEFMSMTGMCGFIYSAISSLLSENLYQYAFSSLKITILEISNAVVLMLFYSLIPFIIKWSGSAIFNISLLSSNLWTMISQYLLFGGFHHHSIYYFISSLILIVAGVSIFVKNGDPYINDYISLNENVIEMSCSLSENDNEVNNVIKLETE